MKIFLWGGRSKARIVEQMLNEAGHEAAVIFDNHIAAPPFTTTATFVADPAQVREHAAKCTHFVACVGGEYGFARARISEFCESQLKLEPVTLIHPTAYVSTTAQIGKGFQAMPNAVVHHFATIGDWSIVNTNAHVDHECRIGQGVHIMGGAALAGLVTIDDYASIGTNATILPKIAIGAGSYIGAGAVVTKNVAENEVVIGMPARHLKFMERTFDEATLLAI